MREWHHRLHHVLLLAGEAGYLQAPGITAVAAACLAEEARQTGSAGQIAAELLDTRLVLLLDLLAEEPGNRRDALYTALRQEMIELADDLYIQPYIESLAAGGDSTMLEHVLSDNRDRVKSLRGWM